MRHVRQHYALHSRLPLQLQCAARYCMVAKAHSTRNQPLLQTVTIIHAPCLKNQLVDSIPLVLLVWTLVSNASFAGT